MRMRALCFLLCCVGAPAGLHADEVYLKNGDRLTGKIVSVTDGKMVIETALSGSVTIDLANIRTFSSAVPVEIHLKDGTVLRQTVQAAEPNEVTLAATPTAPAEKLPLSAVAAINPPAVPKVKWTGSVSGAVGITTGNTQASTISGSASLNRRTERDRTTAEGDIAKSRQTDPDSGESKTTEDWWRVRGQYDYFFTKKFFGFGNARYETDSIANLERRVVPGGGVGYQWIENPTTAFSTNLGFAWLFEKYENQGTRDTPSLQAGYNLSRQLLPNTKLLHDLMYFPSLERFSDFFLTSTLEVRTNLTKAMFANFKVILNYDATPAPGRDNTDVKYLLGIGMNF